MDATLIYSMGHRPGMKAETVNAKAKKPEQKQDHLARHRPPSPQPDWPASKVASVSVASLVPAARNARTHSDAQIAQIAAAIKEWGWTVPVLIDENHNLIAGHGRVMAAKSLGLTSVPAVTARGWSEAQKKAYLLADNQIAANSGWDSRMLAIELTDLQAVDFDLGLIGFDAGMLEGLTSDFQPNLNPTFNARPVTEADIVSAGDSLESRFRETAKQNLIDIDCPHCGQAIRLNKDAL